MGWFEQSCEDNPVGVCKRCCAVGDTLALYLDIVPNCIVLDPGGKCADHYPVLYMNLCKDCLKGLEKWANEYEFGDINETEADTVKDEENQDILNRLNAIRKEVDEIYGKMFKGDGVI